MEYEYKKRQKRGPRGRIAALAKFLIKQNELTDKEMCEYIKSKYPEASTSVKAIQYYRHQMRVAGDIPPAKNHTRKVKTILMWELVPREDAIERDTLEGQYSGKQLIEKCRAVLIKLTKCPKGYAYETLYSVPSCALFLNELHWDCIEFQAEVKTKEYVEAL